jgi:predicted HTH transcriptional regulator
MKVIEQWGTGIPRIIEMCKEYELQEPKFIEIGMDFRVNLYRKQDADKTDKQLIKNKNQLIEKENQLIRDGNQLIEKENQLIERGNQLIGAMDGNANTKENARLLLKRLVIIRLLEEKR